MRSSSAIAERDERLKQEYNFRLNRKPFTTYINREGSFGLEKCKQIKASREQEDTQLCPSQSDIIIELLVIKLIEYNKGRLKTIFYTLRLHQSLSR